MAETISSCAARIIFSKRARMEEASSLPPSRGRVRGASSRATSCSCPPRGRGPTRDARRKPCGTWEDTLRACSIVRGAGGDIW